MRRSKEVDRYIAGFPKGVQTRLRKLRAIVHANAPRAQELISYRIPAYRGDGMLLYFAGFKAHVGMFPPVRGDVRLVRALQPYAGPKGNLKFPHDAALPLALIARIVRWRVRQDRAKAAAKKKSRK